MTATTLSDPGMAKPFVQTRWGVIAIVLGMAAVAVLGLFGEESRSALQIWMESTAYGHCFFVVPISIFLAWERRELIAATPIHPLPWLGLLALPAGLVWFVVERLGIMEGQQLIIWAMVQWLALSALGWRMYRALAVPLLYLVFLVPFGAFLTPMLQDFTARFIDVGLDVLGIPHVSDGNTVEIAEGSFFVAEACAGLRFLIAAIAFGVLYACMIYRSAGRRIVFIVASVIIPIIANGLRATGIVALGHVLGSAQAAAVDHVLYGWLFFSLVILLLIAAGLPFREDNTAPLLPAPAPDSPHVLRRAVLAALLVVALIGIAPIWTGWLERQDSARPLDLGVVIGCLPQGPVVTSGNGTQTQNYSCPIGAGPIDHLDLHATRLSAHASAGALPKLANEESQDSASESSDVRTIIDVPDMLWRLITTSEPTRITALAAWVDGVPARGGWAQRLTRARNSIAGTTPAPLLITLGTPHRFSQIPPTLFPQLNQAISGLIARNRTVLGIAGSTP